MAGLATLSDITYAIKTTYPDTAISVINDDSSVMYNKIAKKFDHPTADKVGYTMEFSIEMGYGGGYGALADDTSDLPDHGNPNGDKATVTPKRLVHRTSFTQAMMNLANTDFKAFRIQMKDRIEAQARHLSRQINRQFFGRPSGLLCLTANAGTGATAIQLGSFVTGRPLGKLLNKGDQIDVFTSETAGTQQLTKVTITAVNQGTNTITVSPAQTWTSGTFVFFAGTRGNELTGLPVAIDDGQVYDSYMNLLRSTYPGWRSLVTTTGAAASLADLNTHLHLAGKNFRPDMSVTTYEIKAKLLNEAFTITRFAITPTTKVKGVNYGAEDLTLAFGVTVEADEDCQSGTWYGFNSKNIMLASPMKGPEYMEEDGNMFSRIANKLAYEATQYWLVEMFNKTPNACIKRSGLT